MDGDGDGTIWRWRWNHLELEPCGAVGSVGLMGPWGRSCGTGGHAGGRRGHRCPLPQWDLVCGYRQLRQMAQSIYMAGVLVGALVLGGLSDRFGRKALLLWSYLQLGVMGTCTAFAPNYASYCAFRFAGGMALSGFGLSIACLVVEWIPTPYRAVTVAITGFSYTLGQILLAGIAYAVPHWRWLQLTVSLPFFAFFCCSWWLAESARWLVLSGKAEKAVKVLQRVAKINRKKEEGEKITVEILRSSMKEELAALKSSYTVSDLVRTPVIRHIFFCLSIVWFSISFSYYGLAMDLQNFGVSIYLIQVIFGAVDVPAKLVVTVSVSYVGRRVSLMVALFLAGLVIIANIFVSTELQTLRTALAVIGKGCLSASFNCVFLYTTELYPTPIRQTGLGFGSTMARVGGIVAPLVKMTEEYYPFLPPAVYGVAPVVATVGQAEATGGAQGEDPAPAPGPLTDPGDTRDTGPVPMAGDTAGRVLGNKAALATTIGVTPPPKATTNGVTPKTLVPMATMMSPTPPGPPSPRSTSRMSLVPKPVKN
nr:solute carrier family 22 member 6-A [Columba livia]